jgi:hypothetical protein
MALMPGKLVAHAVVGIYRHPGHRNGTLTLVGSSALSMGFSSWIRVHPKKPIPIYLVGDLDL